MSFYIYIIKSGISISGGLMPACDREWQRKIR